ncbi:MAG TPA: lasso peptide biosynthesis B2 protein [Gemmatimonadaceae bacterium]|nr:lasso peptide biosynthesis B2 protein [Gemmatimonadaceae bacterium]
MTDHLESISVRSSLAAAIRHRPPSVATCAIALVVVKGALRVAGFARTLRAVEWLTRGRAGEARSDREFVLAADHAVAVAAALYPGRALCLEQSLVLYHLLRHGGVAATLRIGVHPYPFSAHAWVECDGAPVNDVLEHVKMYAPLPASADRR